jgi:hypothetical protein
VPAREIFEYLVEKSAKIVCLFGSADEHQRYEPWRLENQVVKTEGPKVGCTSSVQEFDKLEAEVGIQRR